jgi:hypothetical protein
MGRDELFYKKITMIKFVAFFILVFPMSLLSQNRINEKDTIPNKLLFDSTILNDINKSAFELFVSTYSDSINNSISLEMLPQFLKDPDFDYHHSNFWFPPHSKISIRNIILLRVSNCASLRLIVSDKTGIYKRKPKKSQAFNSYNLSFFDLARRRFDSLECDN